MKSMSRKLSCICGLAAALALAGLSLTGCSTAAEPAFAPMPAPLVNLPYVEPPIPVTAQHERSRHATSQTVTATRYSSDLTGNRTSGGDIYDPNALTAASRTLPLGSTVKVTDVKSGHSVNVLVNDRGPRGRSLDLSAGAAQALGLDEHKGVTKVKITRQLRPRPPVPSD
jgi:rare lipoprotein A